MTRKGRRVERKTNPTIEEAGVSSFLLSQFELLRMRRIEVWTIIERHTVTSSTSDCQHPLQIRQDSTYPSLPVSSGYLVTRF